MTLDADLQMLSVKVTLRSPLRDKIGSVGWRVKGETLKFALLENHAGVLTPKVKSFLSLKA